ncbi:MAG: aldehyde ferredoxin oxidoreductase family protein [Rectinemataceae bacterium]
MPKGYSGVILRVNLTTGTIGRESPPESLYRSCLGGSALGLHYILAEVPRGADPLGPENVLTLMTGVTTGAPISGQSRINANAKSPISGGIGDSQGGGYFPAELKLAGFDGIIITGASAKPVYLWIKDGKAELRDAAALAGLDTAPAEDRIREDLGEGKAQILQHGPAAEKGVLFSALLSNSNRANGRTGMGAVMASKKLRAVAVRGTGKVAIADQAALTALAREGAKNLPDNPDVAGLGKYGTASVLMGQNSMGTLPTRNYNEGQFEDAEALSGERIWDNILRGRESGDQDRLGRETCHACIVRCKRIAEVKEGKYRVDPRYGGAEYETLAVFGSYCGISDLAAVNLANQLCNAAGIDTIACGATIAFAIECFEKGILTTKDSGGLELRFGDPDVMLELLRQIASASTPLGRLLGKGSAKAAAEIGKGAQDCLVTFKGSEAPAHMPQAKRSLSLIYMVNPFGADHQSSEHDWIIEEGIASDLYMQKLSEIGLDTRIAASTLEADKIRFAWLTGVFYSMLDSLELCQFVWGPGWTLYGPKDVARLVKAVTGWDVTVDELMAVGERRLNLLRAFNAREGFDRSQDSIPTKFLKPLVGAGPTAGYAFDASELQKNLDEYYRLAGWDELGIPRPETLRRLGIEAVAGL